MKSMELVEEEDAIRSRQALPKEYLMAPIVVDTAENGLSKLSTKIVVQVVTNLMR